MAIYEYECPICGTFEVEQKITDESLKKCPTCGSEIEKQISKSTFILKGTGFYKTDYKKNEKV